MARGAAYLAATQDSQGLWTEPWYTAPGFPRVFYLKYHGYSAYFPVWALARHARLIGLHLDSAGSVEVPSQRPSESLAEQWIAA